MKKLFAILVAIAMVLTLTVTALADAGGRLIGDENNVGSKAINASSAEVGTIGSHDGTISRNTEKTVVEELAEKLGRDELAPYVFIFTPNTTGEVTIENIEIRSPYKFLRVWYNRGGEWSPWVGEYTPIDQKVTFDLPADFTGGPIAITVVGTTGGGGDVPVSPQTGEMTTAAYLLGAAVMAAACAAFVVKSRKAA